MLHVFSQRLRKYIVAICLFLLIIACTLLIANGLIHQAAKDKLYHSTAEIPYHKTGLVLGCAKTLINGRRNLYFQYRIDAAVKLFRAGKIDYILVSGDNSVIDYDEPSDMKNELIRLGVPESRITCDYAGFRTLDSIIRAKEVFQQSDFTIISQKFHNKRAIFIANHHNLHVSAFNARDVSRMVGFKTKIREQLAKVYTLLDLYVFNTGPKFYGPKIEIGQNN